MRRECRVGGDFGGTYGIPPKAGTTACQTPIAAADPACLRSSNFWILPVEVLGNSPNTTAFGTLKPARCFLQCATMSAAVTFAPAFSSTKAQGVSPHFGSGLATTAAASTSGWRYSTSSTSIDEMFSPPEMMMSLLRSLILM